MMNFDASGSGGNLVKSTNACYLTKSEIEKHRGSKELGMIASTFFVIKRDLRPLSYQEIEKLLGIKIRCYTKGGCVVADFTPNEQLEELGFPTFPWLVNFRHIWSDGPCAEMVFLNFYE